jgi:hypothetical protein
MKSAPGGKTGFYSASITLNLSVDYKNAPARGQGGLSQGQNLYFGRFHLAYPGNNLRATSQPG